MGICARPSADSLYPKEVGVGSELRIDRMELGHLALFSKSPVCLGFSSKVMKFDSKCCWWSISMTFIANISLDFMLIWL